MTILESSTPAVDWISKTELLGQVEEDEVSKPEQVVYSLEPRSWVCELANKELNFAGSYPGCRTERYTSR